MANRWQAHTRTVGAAGRQIVQGLGAAMQQGDLEALSRHFVSANIPRRPSQSKLHQRTTSKLTDHLNVDRSEIELGEEATALTALLRALSTIRVERIEFEDDPYETFTVPHLVVLHVTTLQNALTRDAITSALATALMDLPSNKWAIGSATVETLSQWSRRRTVGPLL